MTYSITHFAVLFAAVAAPTVLVYLYPTSTKPCPESCKCTDADPARDSAMDVDCGGRNLRRVPHTTKDEPVSLLNLSFNVLKTLEDDALLNYSSVKYLYIQHSQLFNINEKAFQGLENLTVVDLSNNRLTSISPNLFKDNHLLEKLILRSNDLSTLQWNKTLLNGPSSLSFLDLQSCRLSNISSVTFSLILNLKILDISRNELVLLDPDTLSSHRQLKDVNLENNPWKCGTEFEVLLCWMQSKVALSQNRTLKCLHKNDTREIWTPENRSTLCGPTTVPSLTPSNKPDRSTNTDVNPTTPFEKETDNYCELLCVFLILSALLNLMLIFLVVCCRCREKGYLCKRNGTDGNQAEQNECEGFLLREEPSEKGDSDAKK